jgi:iron complex outermembrane recepter protein
MKNYFFAILTFFVMNQTIGQELSGRVVDASTNEGMPSVSIVIKSIGVGIYTDANGYFKLVNSLPEEFEIEVSMATFETQFLSVNRGDTLLIKLEEHHLNFQDVIVSSPGGGVARTNAFRVEHLKIKELNAIQSSSLGEAISNINGVQQASLGVGISKLVIRGMQGMRVLTLLNGMRIENQQWGGDHGMAVSQLGVEAVEIIKGPSSLLYGGDAFGGVVYLIDAPYAKQNSQEIELTSIFESVNLGTTNTLSYKVSKGIFRLNLAGIYSNNADYQLPNGKFAQNSRYLNQGVKLGVGISKKNWVSHLRYIYSNDRVGIPGHTHDSIINPLDFQVENTSREFAIPVQKIQNHIFSFENKFFFGKNELEFLLGNTFNDLSEYEEKITIPGMQVKLNSTLLNLRYKHVFSEQWKMIAGYQGMYQINANNPKAEEQLIPGFNQLDNGVYAIAYFSINKWNAQLGARYDIRNLYVNEKQFNSSYGSPNFSIGGTHSSTLNTFRLNISTGFRAPHLSELFSDGIHHGTLRYEIGNQSLKSEYATQVDFSYELHGEHIEFIVNPFYNYIQNYIQILPVDSIIDGAKVFVYDQSGDVNLYGVDAGFHYHPHFAHWLHLESSYSYIRGEELSGSNLSLMPQARINSFLKVNFAGNKKFKISQISLQHQYYFKQSQVTSYESNSRDYHLLNLGMDFKWNLKTPIDIGIGAKNILNTSYINHLSRLKNIDLQHPGRSFYIKVGITISNQFKNKQI